MFDNLLDELGLKNEIQFIDLAPPSKLVGSDYNLPLTPLENLAAELKKMFPGDVQNIDMFFHDCRAVTSEILALARRVTGRSLVVQYLLWPYRVETLPV